MPSKFSQEPPLDRSVAYEVRVEVDFKNRLLRPMPIAGLDCGTCDTEAVNGEVVVYARERCHPQCELLACKKCRPKKLYQDLAGNPKGMGLIYRPHNEYLYCLRFNRRPAQALLCLTPREQNVEVKELGLLACWFATSFQRAKATQLPRPLTAAVASASQEVTISTQQTQTPRPQPVEAVLPPQTFGESLVAASQTTTSRYIPNMRIIYQVRQDLITVTLPQPSQLTREIEILLICRKDVEPKIQSALLTPGQTQADCDLVAARDLPYTLMAKLHGQGNAVEMLDLATERKVLRVQESRLAPRHMNFLMERRVDQRATFVLHVTFDEQDIDVGSQWLGEFFLDVDTETNALIIGTVPAHARKSYRVEKLLASPTGAAKEAALNPITAKRAILFEGGVDPNTLFIRESVQIQRSADYLISVLDPETGTIIPTSVLSFQKTSLFVKEIKGSEVRLHVTVQRNLTPAAAAASAAAAATRNKNNLQDGVAAAGSAAGSPVVTAVQRSHPDAAFHCPFGECYRIFHHHHHQQQQQQHGQPASSGGDSGMTTDACSSRSSGSAAAAANAAAVAATEAALAAAEASSHSCVGRSSCASSNGGGSGGGGCDDSGLGGATGGKGEGSGASFGSRNQSSLSDADGSLHDLQSCGSRGSTGSRLVQQQQQQQRRRAVNVNLDVDLPQLQARLLPDGSATDGTADGPDEDDAGTSCYLVVEESQIGGRPRSVPCQLGQSFSVNRWCRYTVKAIEEREVKPLFTFRLTDREVSEVCTCSPLVRLTQTVTR